MEMPCEKGHERFDKSSFLCPYPERPACCEPAPEYEFREDNKVIMRLM